ncbi:MAG TPA: DUF6279 family lipoprotein [Usitatibacter sp.]|nr:DUF6279 family lipoprotein [Usitatibacter sp.]
MPRGTRHLLLAVLALLAAACTRLAYVNAPLAYSQAPHLAAWTVEGYVDLSREQKEWLHARLDRAMAWHRSQELPRYASFLESVAQRSDRAFTDEEVQEAWADVRADYRRVVEHLLPDAAILLASLDEEQLAHLQRRFDEENRKFVRESTRGTPAERSARVADKMEAHLKEWVGPLDARQSAIVAAWARSMPALVEERLADRRYRQSQAIALARTRDRQRIADGLHRILIDTDAWRSPELGAKLEAREQSTLHMIAVLSGTLSAAQRAHLRERIGGYVKDVARLTTGA